MKLTKSGRPDRRCKVNKSLEVKEYMFWKKYGTYISVGILGFIAGTILTKTLWDINHPKQLSRPLSQTIEVKPIIAQERQFCNDVINCIRDVGEQLGRDNNTIMTMIRIAKQESNFRERAKNPRSSASGVFQIVAGTWYSNDCVGDKWNAEDNIRCAYKIQSKRGFQPWEVCNTGKAQCY